MTTTFRVEGQLQHHFWGKYSAAISIMAPGVDPRQLRAQLPVLEGVAYSKDYKLKDGYALVARCDSVEAVQRFEAWAEERRVDKTCNDGRGCNGKAHPIGSTAHSIDYGPPFELELPFVDVLTPNLPFPEPKTDR